MHFDVQCCPSRVVWRSVDITDVDRYILFGVEGTYPVSVMLRFGVLTLISYRLLVSSHAPGFSCVQFNAM
jgi:hypothetical protein